MRGIPPRSWVPGVLGDQITRKEINFIPTCGAVDHFDPKEILHRHVCISVLGAIGQIKMLDLGAKRRKHLLSRSLIGGKI